MTTNQPSSPPRIHRIVRMNRPTAPVTPPMEAAMASDGDMKVVSDAEGTPAPSGSVGTISINLVVTDAEGNASSTTVLEMPVTAEVLQAKPEDELRALSYVGRKIKARLEEYLPLLPIHPQTIIGLKLKPFKTLKESYYAALRIAHGLEQEREDLKVERQKACNHPADQVKIVEDSYFEPGKMAAPVPFKKKVCKLCHSVLATSRTEVIEHWSDEPAPK